MLLLKFMVKNAYIYEKPKLKINKKKLKKYSNIPKNGTFQFSY